jgi:hypothetical protein
MAEHSPWAVRRLCSGRCRTQASTYCAAEGGALPSRIDFSCSGPFFSRSVSIVPGHPLAPAIDLAPWQLAVGIANRAKPPRIRQALNRGRVVLRIHALIEAIILHPGVLAGFIVRHRAVGAAYRAAEGLCPVVHVAKLANMQPGIAPADITPDPQRSERPCEVLRSCRVRHGRDRPWREPRSGGRWGRINFLACRLAIAAVKCGN